MKTMILSLAAALILIAPNANAGILLEPYLSYDSGTFTEDLEVSGTKYSFPIAATGMGFGARVGYKLPLLFVALDYGTSTNKLPATTVSGLTLSEASGPRTTTALVVGADLLMFRVFGGYAFSDVLKAKVKDSTSEYTFTGTGLKVGGGFSPIPFLSVNVEYLMSTYTKIKDQNGTEADLGSSAAGMFKAAKGNTLILSVSAPFSL